MPGRSLVLRAVIMRRVSSLVITGRIPNVQLRHALACLSERLNNSIRHRHSEDKDCAHNNLQLWVATGRDFGMRSHGYITLSLVRSLY
jgi:hypothetical protein